MTRDEAVEHIQTILGFRTDLTTKIIAALKLAQTTLESHPTKPWFLLSEYASIRTTSGEARVQVPSDFLIESDQSHLYYVPDDTEELEVALLKNDFDTLKKQFEETDPGPPQAYAIQGGYFYLFPEPDDLYLISMRYFTNAEVLDSNVENAWLKHTPYSLIGKAGWLIASSIRDKEAQNTFRSMELEGKQALLSHDINRELANQVLQMGGDH